MKFNVGDLVMFNPEGDWSSLRNNIGIVYKADVYGVFTYVYWLIDSRAKPRGNGGFYPANLMKVS